MFRLCKAILPQMKESGSIVNTGSIQSFDPSASLIAYASTKAAIVSFTRSLASSDQARRSRQRRSPRSCVDSTYPFHYAHKEKVKQFGSQTVFGRAAQPVEIALIFVFLASDFSSQLRHRGSFPSSHRCSEPRRVQLNRPKVPRTDRVAIVRALQSSFGGC